MSKIAFAARAAAVLLVIFLAACGKTRTDAADVMPVDELYNTAKRSLDNGNNGRAIQMYKRLIARFPFGKYNEQSQLELAYAQYKDKQFEDGLSTINRFIKLYPTHERIDYAYYLRGLINFNRESGLLSRYLTGDKTRHDLTYARQSFQDFGELIKRFPDSKYVDDSRQRMVYLRDGLAQFELNVADYYFRREAYVAAVNRAKTIVDEYQQTKQCGDALAIMAEGYARLGQEQLAEDAKRVLKQNYPEHEYFSGGWPHSRNRLWSLIPFVGSNRPG